MTYPAVPISAQPHPLISGYLPDGKTTIYNILRIVSDGCYINKDHILFGNPDIVKYAPIPESTSQRHITPRSAILHSNAGPNLTPWESLWKYWNRADITGEAHCQVPLSGPGIQIIPFNRVAHCNYKANEFDVNGVRYGAISFETGDNGYKTLDQTPWTPSQLKFMICSLVNICVVYGVWCTAPATWNDSGIGHHVLFKEWSSYIGKTCPGAARIRQMDYIRNTVASKLITFGELTGWKCGKGFN